jgi:hypothetical protein
MELLSRRLFHQGSIGQAPSYDGESFSHRLFAGRCCLSLVCSSSVEGEDLKSQSVGVTPGRIRGGGRRALAGGMEPAIFWCRKEC